MGTAGDGLAQAGAKDDFCKALQKVAKYCIPSVDLGEALIAHFDVYSPTDLIDAFYLAASPHQLGSLFDAAETMQHICRWTGLGDTAVDAKSAEQCDGVLSCAVEAEHLLPEAFSVDLGAALSDAFVSGSQKLSCAPKVLAIQLGDCCVSDANIQLYGLYAATWPADGIVWLPIKSESVAYRVKAVVEKAGDHLVAHFRGGTTDS